MIIILSILIIMLLLTIGLNVGIKDFKKLRGIVDDEKLTETIKKFPCNTEICKQTLKKLNKEDVKVEEDNSSKTSVYLVFKNKIVIGKANVITRIQTVIHECIHSTQNKKILWFNYIFANLLNIFWLITMILTIAGVITQYALFSASILICIIIFYVIRSYLEIEAMTKAKYIAKEYLEENQVKETDEIVEEYEKLNDIGIKYTCYKLISSKLYLLAIYTIMGCILNFIR